ncbi:MAG TPA: general secretion pathway protein GspB [Gammaproteobacteria bacterium]|nr:general secretion pathway protein GspB [Gammaproteobacteria bacterium]
MSFILDALRKSEHERQRSATPGIAQVPFGAPRRELPRWAVALIVVLAVAVLALGGAWLRSEWSGAARQARERAPTELPVGLPPGDAPRSSPAAERVARDIAARSSPQSSVRSAAASPSPALGSALPPSRERAAPSASPAFESAAAPFARTETADAPRARGSEPVLPSAASLAAEGIVVPPLQLQLLAYYDRPADRYVFINGAKYVEGATLAEGPKVVSIEASGAVLSYLGHQFLLSQQ